MEDNNAINEQLNVVDYEKEYKALVEKFNQTQTVANQLYERVKQLENTWMLQRAEFLFRIINMEGFSAEVKDKAHTELENFLFPKVENKES